MSIHKYDKYIVMNDLKQLIEMLTEYSEEGKPVLPRPNLPLDYYLAAATNLWVAVRFGLGNRLGRGGGDKGAIFDWFMNTTAKNPGIVVGISKNSRDGGSVYHEHIVPCKLIVDKAVDIYQDGATPGELQDDKIEFRKIKQVARLIRDNLFVVKITKEEAALIDKDLGLQTRMPAGWQWGDDPFARLGAVGKSSQLKKKFGKQIAIQVYDINNPSSIIYGPGVSKNEN